MEFLLNPQTLKICGTKDLLVARYGPIKFAFPRLIHLVTICKIKSGNLTHSLWMACPLIMVNPLGLASQIIKADI